MNLEDNDSIKFKALERSHYCPPYKEDSFIETFELEEFDVDKAKEEVRGSVAILSHSNRYRELIIEILDVLDRNKGEFLTDKHKYISFYWSGIPVLLLKIENGVNNERQLHISLQKYKSDKRDIISDKKTNRFIMFGLGTTLVLGGILVGVTLFRKKGD